MKLILNGLLLIVALSLLFNPAFAEQKKSGYLLLADGSKIEFISLNQIDIDGQTEEGRLIKSKDKRSSILFAHKGKEVKVSFDEIKEIEIKSYEVVKSGDNDFYLSNGTFRLVTQSKTFKNLSFDKFREVEVRVLDELSEKINTTTYRAGTSVNGKPVIQIRSIIFNR